MPAPGIVTALLLLAALVAVALVVPPFAPALRLWGGYTDLVAAPYYHPDGLALYAARDQGQVRARVESLPREAFIEGTAGPEWLAARSALPDNLIPLSPVFTIRTHGAGQVEAEMSLPNDAAPLSRLSLYAWNRATRAWVFVPGRYDSLRQLIVFAPEETPLKVMAVRVEPLTPAMGIVAQPGDAGIGTASGLVFAGGVSVDESGALVGRPVETSASMVLPVITSRQGADLYADIARRPLLVQGLVDLSARYDGLALDFTGGGNFTDFVAVLAQELHARGKRLDLFIRGADGLDSYDLQALSRHVDGLWIDPGSEPAAFLPGGSAARLLDAACAVAARDRVGLLASALGADVSGSGVESVAFEEGAARFGDLTPVAGYLDPDHPAITTGSVVPFRLSSAIEHIGYDETLSMNYAAYRNQAGDIQHVYFSSALALYRRLGWARDYSLGGVAVYGLLGGQEAAEAALALDALAQQQAPAPPPGLMIVWRVRDSSGAEVAAKAGGAEQAQYLWRGSTTPGQYTISVSVYHLGQESLRGQMSIEVIQP